MSRLSSLALRRCFLNSDIKMNHNKKLFSVIGPKYNLVTRILSLGRDQYWKQTLIKHLPNIQNPICLDIACGTGDVTFKLAQKYSSGTIYGLDVTQAMIDQALKINKYSNISFVCQDMCNANFNDNTFDIITGSYALRNSPDLKKALIEMHRLLNPGGVLAILDFYKFDNKIAQKVQYYVLKFWGSLWGIIFHGNHTVYAYIAESLKHHPASSELLKIIKEHNFDVEFKKRFVLGTEVVVLKKGKN